MIVQATPGQQHLLVGLIHVINTSGLQAGLL